MQATSAPVAAFAPATKISVLRGLIARAPRTSLRRPLHLRDPEVLPPKLMPGFFLFNAATGLVELVSIGPTAPATLLVSIATNGATTFLIIMAMTFGLILPRMLFERVLPAPA